MAGIDSSAATTALPFCIIAARADQALVQELDTLRLKCAALSSVSARQSSVTLVFLGLEAELKFSVQIEIGE